MNNVNLQQNTATKKKRTTLTYAIIQNNAKYSIKNFNQDNVTTLGILTLYNYI